MRMGLFFRKPLVGLAACLPILAVGLSNLGCTGSVNGSANWSSAPKEEVRPVREVTSLASGGADSVEAAKPTVLGVRPDLWLADGGGRTPKCSCLAVAIGQATDPRMHWRDNAAEVRADALAFAMSPMGVECPGGDPDETKRRASISAVDTIDSNVVIEVEEVPEGRPLAWGAIIPKPARGGSVYVQPKNPKSPYGRPGGVGLGRCKVYERLD